MSLPREIIEHIINAGVQAPSGGNSQPWRFEVLGNAIRVVALPEKDHPVLNYQYRGTWIAHGALIENISIAAAAKGYRADVELFPDPQEPLVTAHITLLPDDTAPSSLYESIYKRATNRKPYQKNPLSPEIFSKLQDVAETISDCKVTFTTKLEEMKKLARALSITEQVMFENRQLHGLFFKEVVWNEVEERAKGGGLNAQTLELKPPQLAMMKLLMKRWSTMKLLNRIGMPKIIAKDNAKIYASASCIGIISVSSETNEAFINAGRALQRIWLTATQAHLSFHPITGILFFWQKIEAGEGSLFSPEHISLIRKACTDIQEVFGIRKDTITFLFRIGQGGVPSAQSIKQPPHIEFIK